MRIILLTCLTILLSCSNSRTDKQSEDEGSTRIAHETIDSAEIEPVPQVEVQKLTMIDSLQMRADTSNLDFHFSFKNANQSAIDFFSGYVEYDEDKYGFQNPAYLKLFIHGELVFEETFEAYEDHWMEYAGTYEFSDTIDFYKLIYGLEASDYIVTERLIAISNSKVQTVDEFAFQATDYASRYTEYIYPPDFGGLTNTIITIDRIDYRTEEEPNLADTTYYDYINSEFRKRGS